MLAQHSRGCSSGFHAHATRLGPKSTPSCTRTSTLYQKFERQSHRVSVPGALTHNQSYTLQQHGIQASQLHKTTSLPNKRRLRFRCRSSSNAEIQNDSKVSEQENPVWYTPSGYFLQEVEAGSDGGLDATWERFRFEVGPVGERTKELFVIKKSLPGPSILVQVSLPKPIGVVFEPDLQGRVRVGDFIPGSVADQMAAVARLGQRRDKCLAKGDVLRAITTSVVSVPTQAALIGDLSGTERQVVLYGVDGQRWGKTKAGMKRGRVADGDVGMVVERPLEGSPAVNWQAQKIQVEAAEAKDPKQAVKDEGSSVGVDGTDDGGRLLIGCILLLVFLLVAGFVY